MRCHVTPRCNRKGRLLWVGKELSHHLNAAQLWKQSILPGTHSSFPPPTPIPTAQQLPSTATSGPCPSSLNPFLPNYVITKRSRHFLGLLTWLLWGMLTILPLELCLLWASQDHAVLLFSPLAASQFPSLLTFLQFSLKCWHYPGVFMSSGFYNKISRTAWLINNRNVFLTVLELQVKEIRVPTRANSGEDLLFVAGCHLLTVSSHGQKKRRELSGVSFKRTLIPFMKAPPHDLITSQRPHFLIPS